MGSSAYSRRWLNRALEFAGCASGQRAAGGEVEQPKGKSHDARDSRTRFSPPAVVVYALIHLGCLGVFYTGVSVEALGVLCGALLLRAFGVSIVYHRYFAHRSFRTSRPMQFLLGVYGALTVLGSPLWWAQTHRYHHQHADTPHDLHSPHYHGFVYAHCGWFLNREHRNVDLSKIRDFARFPELLWLERWDPLFKLLYLGCCYWLFGVVGIVWGFFVATVIILHMIHWVQSVSHCLGGYRRYPTPDDSRNHWLFGVVSMGEGFHHNHHCFPNSARMGLRWWELDASYGVLVVLSRLGLVWDLRVPGESARAGRDPRVERHVVTVRAEVCRLGDRLDRALDTFGDVNPEHEAPGTAHRDLKHRLGVRIEAFGGRVQDLLVAGPFVLQQALADLRGALRQDVYAALAADPGDPRTYALIERIDAALVCEPMR